MKSTPSIPNRIVIAIVLLLSSIQARRKPPPRNWDKGPCLHLAEHGPTAACRSCTDKKYGFGADYKQMLQRALLQTSSTASATPEAPAWLRIAIGTIPRTTQQPYLERVLNSIADELPHNLNGHSIPPLGRIEVVVVNFRPKQHKVFDRVRKAFTAPSHPAREHFTFLELDPVRCDPPVPDNWAYKKGLSPEVSPRQQTRDIVSLYKTVGQITTGQPTKPTTVFTATQPTCQHALIVEDDFELCPGGLHLIKHAITKASKGGWSGLRVGVAGNGIVIPCHDLEPITNYLLEHQYMMPVDLLLPEWFIRIHKSAKGYLHASEIFRINDKNLFNHIGIVSSFDDGRGIRRTSMCGDTLKTNTWMKQESFDTKCSPYGLSPCSTASMKINAVNLKYHSSSHRDSVPGHIQVIKGKVGESCDTTCANGKHRHGDQIPVGLKQQGLTCGSSRDFLSINNCRYLRRQFNKCRGGCLTLQTMVAQNSIGGVSKDKFGSLAPGSIAMVGESESPGESGSGLCWHRQSSSKHVMVSYLDQPSNCAAKHLKIARLCPCVDVSLMAMKEGKK